MNAQKLSMERAVLLDLQDLPHDIKRILRVQVKELIHMIEDREFEGKQKLHQRRKAA